MGHRVPAALEFQLFIFFIWGAWRAGGLMLVGMALYKLGVFSAKLSARSYALMIGVGLLVGLPVVALGVLLHFQAGWSVEYSFFQGQQPNYWGSLLVSLGYVSLVMLWCKRSQGDRLQRSLAAVGQMALSNYLLHTVICTLLFYGHGLGLFGQVSRVGQAAVVVAIWLLQLVISPIWLRHYRFGPLEWVWRCLTYWKLQPFRRS